MVKHPCTVALLALSLWAVACDRERTSPQPAVRAGVGGDDGSRPMAVLGAVSLCEDAAVAERRLEASGVEFVAQDAVSPGGQRLRRLVLANAPPELVDLGLERWDAVSYAVEAVDGRIAAVVLRVEDGREVPVVLFDDLVVRWGERFGLPDWEQSRWRPDGSPWRTAVWEGERQDLITLDDRVVDLRMTCAELAEPLVPPPEE